MNETLKNAFLNLKAHSEIIIRTKSFKCEVPSFKEGFSYITAFFLLCLTLIAALKWNSDNTDEFQDAEMVHEVHAYRVKREVLNQKLEFSGTISAKEKVSITSRIQGRIAAVYRDAGDRVKKGDLLAELETFDLKISLDRARSGYVTAKSQLDQAHARYSRSRKNTEKEIRGLDKIQADLLLARSEYLQAKQQYSNKKELYGLGGISRQELIQSHNEYISQSGKYYQMRKQMQISSIGFRKDDLKTNPKINAPMDSLIDANTEIEKSDIQAARAALKNAALEIKTAELYLKESKIRSPMDGIIANRTLETGEESQQGQAIFTVYNDEELLVSMHIPESDSPLLQKGLPAECRIDSAKIMNTPGELFRISPVVDSASRSLEIQISVKNPENRLTPGMFARCSISIRKIPNAVSVPASAVIEERISENEKIYYVYLVSDGKAKKKPVVTGVKINDRIEILSGLSENDAVITDGLLILKENSGVKIIGENNEKFAENQHIQEEK